MRNRLMNAMGIGAAAEQSPPKQSTLPFRSASSAGTPYTQPLTTPGRLQTQIEPEEDLDEFSLGSATSSQHGPTPKRSKPRKPFKVPTVQQPLLTAGGLRSAKPLHRSTSAPVRQPLADIPANKSPSRASRSPNKVAFAKHDAGGGGASLSTGGRNALAEWSFTTDVLSSTPGTRRLEMDYQMDDESTMDA